jgi:hypothetical protein
MKQGSIYGSLVMQLLSGSQADPDRENGGLQQEPLVACQSQQQAVHKQEIKVSMQHPKSIKAACRQAAGQQL